MTYAIVKIGGKQFKVAEGDTFLVNKIAGEKGLQLEFKEVYLLNSDSGVKIGQPHVPGVSVKAVIEEQVKGDKIMVAKFKSKVRHRRKMGFRAKLTRIKIIAIKTEEDENKKKISQRTQKEKEDTEKVKRKRVIKKDNK